MPTHAMIFVQVMAKGDFSHKHGSNLILNPAITIPHTYFLRDSINILLILLSIFIIDSY